MNLGKKHAMGPNVARTCSAICGNSSSNVRELVGLHEDGEMTVGNITPIADSLLTYCLSVYL